MLKPQSLNWLENSTGALSQDLLGFAYIHLAALYKNFVSIFNAFIIGILK